MNVEETVFFIALIALIAITFVRLFNVLKSVQFYDHIVAVMLFTGILLLWGISLMCSIIDFNNLLLMQLQKVCNFLLGLNTMFALVELLLYTSFAGINFVTSGNVFRKRAMPQTKT